MFCTIGLTASSFSVYLPYITDYGQLTKTQSSVLITIRSLFSLMSVIMVNRFYQRAGIRFGSFLSVTIGMLGFFCYSIVKTFPGFCLASAVTGISHGLGGMYPISILIHRWFRSHQGLALGICAAGSGAASIVLPPVITLVIEATSLQTGFRVVGIFICLSAIAVFWFVRSTPEELGMKPLMDQNAKHKDVQVQWTRTKTVGKASMLCMLGSAFLLGAAANGTLHNITMLYTTEGFERLAVSFLVSLCGIAQTSGKCIYGQISDWLGARKSGNICFSVLIIGVCLTCLAGVCGYSLALCAVLLCGLGAPLYTVGISVFARDISSAEDYPVVLKHFQVCVILGGLVVSVIPGILCDWTGSYVPAYILFALCATLSMVLAHLTYCFDSTKKVTSD